MTLTQAARSLDLRGKTITTYIIYAVHRGLEEIAEGERLQFTTDSFAAIASDVHSWCRVTGNALVDEVVVGDEWTFTVEKGPARHSEEKLALIIGDDGLFELLTPLGFALAAALDGHAVSLYFNGPAVRVLAKGYKARMHGVGKPFSRFPREGLAKAGHVEPQVKIAQLLELGARIFVCGPSMEHFKVDESDLAFAGMTIAEYLTFMEEMATASMQISI